jgi:hypothetical protein
MPGRRGINYIPIGKQKIIEIGPGLSISSTYGGGYRGNATETFLLEVAGGSTCPMPMTRTALIALRNASGLTKDCDYVVTDHVQGRLVAGTQIHLQAVSANKLSENVSVNTTYDNEAWAGIYDLDRGLVLELHDNRNNVARGANGTEVSNFDWGNANITSTTVDYAVWTSTIGSTRLVSSLTVKDGATLLTTGWAGGTITGGTIIRGINTVVNMTNANVSLLEGEYKGGTQFNLSTYTGATTLTRYNLNASNFNFSGSTSGVSVTNVTAIGSIFNHANVTTGTVTGVNLILENNATITHTNGAGNLSLNRVKIEENGQITHTGGTIALSDYIISGASAVQQTGTGNISLSNEVLTGQSTVTNNSAVSINGTRYGAKSNGIVSVQTGAVGTVTLTGTNNNSGQINKTTTSTAGSMTILTTTLNNTSVIQQSGTGNLQITDTTVDSNSRITLTNTRGLTVTRGRFSNLVQITQTGTGAVVDSLIDSTGDTRGIYNLSSTGAAAHQLSYAVVRGLGGNINISGTSTGQVLNRVKADSGSYNFNNNTIANSYSAMTATDGSNISFQNMTVAKAVNNVTAMNSGNISVNNPTGTGSINGLVAIGNGGININGTARQANGLYARSRGIITHNGGNATDLVKEMTGTLTTGAFTHTNVVVINPTSITLTANNSNTSSYRGIVSSTPTV